MRFKRICSILTAISIIGSCGAAAAVNNDDLSDAVFELSSLGIFTGDENRDLLLNQTMTRAEFAKTVAVMRGCGDIASISAAADLFKDVPSSHWASGYIQYCSEAKLMTGDGDGTFRPDDPITLQECVKTLVTIMGYEVVAIEQGGYSGGYTQVAIRKHLFDNVEGSGENNAIRQDILFLIYNALDVPNLVSNYADDRTYKEDTDTTIRSIIEKANQAGSVTGIVTANRNTWLVSENADLAENQIEIDGKLYDVEEKIAQTAADMIGCEVTAYYTETNKMRRPLIYNIAEITSNDTTVIAAEDIQSFTESQIRYWTDDDSREKNINLASGTRFIYNNRPENRYMDYFNEIENGEIRVLDNNGDGIQDFVFINEYKSYAVESAHFNGNIRVKYLSDESGETKVEYSNIMLDDDDENSFSIKNTAGDKMNVEDIKAGMTISIYENKRDSFIQIIVNENEPVHASVVSKLRDRKIMADNEYKVSGKLLYDWLTLGEPYVLYIDGGNNVVYAEKDRGTEAEQSEWKYGYIYKSNKKGFGTVEYMVLNAGNVQNKEESNLEDRTDTTTIAVTLCQNDSVVTLTAADTVNVDGSSVKNTELDSLIGVPMRYRTNQFGVLKQIQTLEQVGGSDKTIYNAKEKVFGTANVVFGTPFMIDDKTKVLCIPDNGTSDTEDLLVQLTLDNKDEFIRYNAFGYDQDEESKASRLLVITKEMKAGTVTSVTPSDAKIALVESAARALNDDGEEYMLLTMIVGTEKKEYSSIPINENRSGLIGLKDGDVIFYDDDAEGRIKNVLTVNNVYDVQNGMSGTDDPAIEQIFGYVKDISYNEIDNVNRIRVNRLEVVTADGIKEVDVPISNYPDMFIYNTSNDTVESGKIDDLVPYSKAVSDGDNVLVVKSGTTIRSIVLIKNK